MEHKSIVNKLQVLGLAVALGALAGCASTGDINKVKATADSAAQTASAAQSSAAAATSAANAASQKADAASMKADRAAQSAQSASSMADKALQEIKALDEKLDRMFKKGMAK